MNISDKGLNLIIKFECSGDVNKFLTAYKDAVGVWTIGVGHTGSVDGKGICRGMKITRTKAMQLLEQDCRSAENKVNKYMTRYNFNRNQYDAMVDFAFNLGSIDKLTANGTRDIETVASKIMLYNKAGGKVLGGLTERRKAELELFRTPVSCTSATGNQIIKSGQIHANNFAQCGLSPDGVRGTKTRQAAVKCVQRALNVDYGANIKEDGAWGSATDKAFGTHYIKVGETQYLVTALEILCNLKGIETAVECPGKFGAGLAAACGTSKAYKDVFKSLCQ